MSHPLLFLPTYSTWIQFVDDSALTSLLLIAKLLWKINRSSLPVCPKSLNKCFITHSKPTLVSSGGAHLPRPDIKPATRLRVPKTCLRLPLVLCCWGRSLCFFQYHLHPNPIVPTKSFFKLTNNELWVSRWARQAECLGWSFFVLFSSILLLLTS